MKRILLAVMMLTTAQLSAQELVSKKGEPFLPEAGDWAVGIDAAPFFTYISSLFQSNSTAPSWQYTDAGATIYGKYFKTEKMVIRGRLRLLGLNSDKDVRFVTSDNPSANIYDKVEDSKTSSSTNFSIGAGLEWRKGKTRLQGFYGGEIFYTYTSKTEEYAYGNALSVANTTPSSSDFGTNLLDGSALRVLKRDFGSGHYVGIRPFVGAEYFLFPKISIGGEFGYSLAFRVQSTTAVTAEFYDFTNSSTEQIVINEGTNNTQQIVLDNDNLFGVIRLMLHF